MKIQSGAPHVAFEEFGSLVKLNLATRSLLPAKAMASSANAKAKPRPRKQVAIQDIDEFKARKQQLKNDLKEMNNAVKVQQQKKRRLMKAAHNLHDEDLVWLLRERENQRNNESHGDPGVGADQSANRPANNEATAEGEEAHREGHAAEPGT